MALLAVLRRHAFGLSVLAFVLSAVFVPLDERHLALSRSALFQGEWWRVITSQIAHLGPAHALMNGLGFIIISVSFRSDFNPAHEALVLVTSMVAVAAGIILLNPEIAWYMGLSGAIYGLLVHHLIVGAPHQRALARFFLLGIVGKLVYEQLWATPDRLTEQLIGGTVAVDAHLYGALWGLVCGALINIIRSARKHSKTAHASWQQR